MGNWRYQKYRRYREHFWCQCPQKGARVSVSLRGYLSAALITHSAAPAKLALRAQTVAAADAAFREEPATKSIQIALTLPRAPFCYICMPLHPK
jgi:hypothetical protein